ncbi:MAG: ABC transporter ATP-binding protein [candidate division Zixibacteria bacterium]|nr:ABC transporter ATP-binding protein [candidate division Zixibacteria bacterium]
MQISIRDLTKQYAGSKYALKGINLEIHNGLFGLLGPNGAGKTTLMSILVTLLKPTSGAVSVNGLDLFKKRKQIRRMVGYLPQNFSVFSKLAVWEFLDYAGKMSGVKKRKVRREKVDRLLDEVGLFDVRDRWASKLSGGMKRRLGIAQSLIGDPKVLIVDEPTVGLDPEERLRFRNLMADLSQTDIIIILSTHIVGDISSTCTDMALLDFGEIKFNGSPERLVSNAKGKVWRVTVSMKELNELKEKYPVISSVPAEGGFEVRIVGDDITGYSALALEPNLEDAYIYFMQSSGMDMNLEASDNGW